MKVHEIMQGFYIRGDFWKMDFYEKVTALRGLQPRWDAKVRVVCLVPPRDMDLVGERCPSWVDYAPCPMPDGKRVPVAKAHEAAEGIINCLRGGGAAIAHCHAGRNRSGLVAAIVVHSTTNLRGDALLAYVRARRPRALANPAFEEYVRAL
jgi:protein-tyrosine phosphatase